MEDYDPSAYRGTTGDVLAAWAVYTMLFAGILFGSFINSSADHDEQNVAVAANSIHDTMRGNIPAQKIISSCER